MFKDRKQAGTLLAKEIAKLLNKEGSYNGQIVVLALPRGGVSVALEVALAFRCPLDVIVSKKIGAPEQSELAIGAVTSDGVVVLDHKLQDYLQIPEMYVESQVQNLTQQTKRSEDMLRKSAGFEGAINISKKCVIVIDDGVATGMTAMAALRSLRGRDIGKLVFATPVISAQTSELLSRECDQLVALATPLDFSSVGQFYFDFQQTEDQEVIDALRMVRQNNQPATQYFST
jgi:putative phosphoribosyl transferase